jgi:DNA-binding response OmpR family regulator
VNELLIKNAPLQARVMLVSDDLNSAHLWTYVLQESHIESFLANSTKEALQQWAEKVPDLIVIDMYSYEFDGIDLVSQLRELGVVPILLLTPVNNETQILQAYNAGVDECVVKPVSPILFLLKVKAWLRRTWSMQAESLDVIQVGGLKLDPTRRLVSDENGQVTKLTNLEFRLLYLLMTHPGWVLTTEEIILKVWGYYGDGDSTLLKNVVYRLRRKIDPDPNKPRFIHTEAGSGYRYQDITK